MNMCWLWHKWGKWAAITGQWRFRDGTTIPANVQERRCERCGKIEREAIIA